MNPENAAPCVERRRLAEPTNIPRLKTGYEAKSIRVSRPSWDHERHGRH